MCGHPWACRLVIGLVAIALLTGCAPDTRTSPSAAQVPSAAAASTTVAPSDVPASTRPLSSLPPELVGSWAAARGSPALTLTPCAEGEVCGRFERVDDNSEHCVYVLQYRPPTSDHFVFISADTNSFGCGYSPWMDEILVRPMSDGTVVVWPEVLPAAGFTLSPVDSSPAPSASPSGGS